MVGPSTPTVSSAMIPEAAEAQPPALPSDAAAVAGREREAPPHSVSSSPGTNPPTTERPRRQGPGDDDDDDDDVIEIPDDDDGSPPKLRSAGAVPEDDPEISIVDPPPRPGPPWSVRCGDDGGGTTKGDDGGDDGSDGDELEIISSNATNPNVHFPHKRPDCGVHSFERHPEARCSRCYCVVCDIPATECPDWATHCRQERGGSGRKRRKGGSGGSADDVLLESPTVTARNSWAAAAVGRNRGGRGPHGTGMDPEGAAVRSLTGGRSIDAASYNAAPTGQSNSEPPPRDPSTMRIVDVLSQKLNRALRFSEGGRHAGESGGGTDQHASASGTELYRMEGDVPQLGLHSSFFVEGVKIGWPFPVILTPQRQMAIHIIKALKRRLHVVLESPTGTGKSVAILCSVLAWQRYHVQTNQDDDDGCSGDELLAEMGASSRMRASDAARGGVMPTRKPRSAPKIIYCSRTHSQVAQMVASLKKTPYRPRMTVLGGRDRLCIHRELKGGTGTNKAKSVPINVACQERRTNTERERKRLLKDRTSMYYYNDDNPRPKGRAEWPGDSSDGGGGGEGNDAGEGSPSLEGGGGGGPRRQAPTCPHFRQLSSQRTAQMVAERLVGNPHRTRCCSTGGEGSSFGVHDLEDLVSFGRNPYYEDNISIYRSEAHDKFGFMVTPNTDPATKQKTKGCHVHEIVKGGAAELESRLKAGDRIVKLNGKDVRSWSLDQVVDELRKTPKTKPLRLSVLRADSDTPELLDEEYFPAGSTNERGEDDHDEAAIPYSEHSPCPYYLSRAIHPHTELTFAPYNYILDPGIRRAMNISLKNTVVVLDEAHNVESTLCEGGSGKYSEIELYQLVSSLAVYARRSQSTGNVSLLGSREEVDTAKVAHDLLLFVEKIVFHLQKLRQGFESSPARTKLGIDYQRFHNIPDDHEVELTYDGPTGFGLKGVPVGCTPFLDRLGTTKEECSQLLHLALSMEQSMFGGSQQDASTDQADASTSNVLTVLVELLSKLSKAAEHPEHFYIACVVQANGNLDHAFGMDADNSSRRWKRKPRRAPFISPRTVTRPNAFVPVCEHPQCNHGRSSQLGNLDGARHGEYCDGSVPPWEAHLVLKLLSPGLLLKDISEECRSVVLASGSLAPIQSLCAELDLFGKEASPIATARRAPSNSLTQSFSRSPTKDGHFVGRLQTLPKPLEANHVVDLSKQLFAVSIGHFPDGQPLTVTYSNFKDPSFYSKLGHAITSVVQSIPKGGVLIFFPSYSFLNKCVSCWNPTYYSPSYPTYDEHASAEIWQLLLRSKGKVIVEPTKSQDAFEAARDEYRDTIEATGSCILLAVFRGKMSEGISFNDDNARGVICVGMPYPNARDRRIIAKKAYNDEQRKLRNKICLLPGQEWYTQQATRAIAQALGRCIRHGADFGTIVLMDSRHCDDGSPNEGICRAHKNLPKWMRSCVRTLSMQANSGVGNTHIVGGYSGLKREMKLFFAQAPTVSEAVRTKWKDDLEKAKLLSSNCTGHVFDRKTRRWTASGTVPKRSKTEKD